MHILFCLLYTNFPTIFYLIITCGYLKNMSQTMKLRSAISSEERENEAENKRLEEIEKENRPFIIYTGKTFYYTDFFDCALACEKLLTMANKCQTDELFVGFDMEWNFSFQTGPGKTALIQISPNLTECYLLHVAEMKSLPKGLSEFLQHPKVRLVGVNIKNDVIKLAKDFNGFSSKKLINNCRDCGTLANSVLPIQQRWSMEKLVNYELKHKINKDKKIRMSTWGRVPLRNEQILYAATDAYVSLLLYLTLKEKENVEDNENPI